MYHNNGNPEDELSQMLLIFLVGIGAAGLSVCIAKSTICCQDRRKRRVKEQFELLDTTGKVSYHKIYLLYWRKGEELIEILKKIIKLS